MSLPVTMSSTMFVHVASIFAIFSVLSLTVQGDTCVNPTVKPNIYTTTESTVSEHTVFIVQFALTCKNNVQNLNLYAEMNGVTVPASRVEGTRDYQVSFSGPHKSLPSGTYPVRVYDEEGYGDLRKAQRSGDDIAAVKSLLTIDVDHQGASSGPWLNSVFAATCVSGLLVYFAHSHKARLEQN